MQEVFGESGRHARSAVGVRFCRWASPSKWMRSSQSGPDPLDPGPKGFAHRGLHYGSAFPENSLIAFAAALEFGAGIECDLRLTADERIVVFHDADAWRMCAASCTSADRHMNELSRLRVGEGRFRRWKVCLHWSGPGAAAAGSEGRGRHLALDAGA